MYTVADALISRGAISGFNLAGSIASVFGSLFVILAHCFLDVKQDSVRTKLILCLAVADFMNAFDNSASGIAALHGWDLTGPWCTLNGFIGQWTVVASDVTVFAIALSTVLALKKPLTWHQNLFWVQRHAWLLVLSLWLYALTTAMIALFTAGYVKSAPNWCWIAPAPGFYRYVLTHAPRIVIIFGIMGMYAWVYVMLRKQARNRSQSFSGKAGAAASGQSAAASGTAHTVSGGGSSGSSVSNRAKKDRLYTIMKMMIIFPVVYTVLWTPGIINRFYNVLTDGGQNSVLDLLQGLTQWIGFGNAVVYGLNEEVKSGFRKAFRRVMSFRPEVDLEIEEVKIGVQ